MNACVDALGRVIGDGDRLEDYIPSNVLHIHAEDNGSSIIVSFNSKFEVELFKPCIELAGGRKWHRKRRSKSSRRRRRTGRRRRVRRARKRTRRRSKGGGQVVGMGTMFKLVGFFFLFLYVEFGVQLRSSSRDTNVLTEDQFMFQDVLKYAPNITAIELTGNVSAPELLQVLEHSGNFEQALQPMALPPSGANHASFVEAKYPEGSATAQLAVAQTAMPHLKRSLISQEPHSFYKWDIDWEIVGGDVKVALEKIPLSDDTRFRTGVNSSAALTQLVLSSAHEQIKTMVQTGLIRDHEISGVASLSLANFVPTPGILPESLKPLPLGYHRDSVGQHNPKFEDQYQAVKEDKVYDALYGPTMVGKESNSTMVRKTFTDQIMSFTYEKGALESKVRAYVQNRDGETKVELIDQTQSGQSNTFMIDQSSGLQHLSRMVPFSQDRRAILFNVMPIQ